MQSGEGVRAGQLRLDRAEPLVDGGRGALAPPPRLGGLEGLEVVADGCALGAPPSQRGLVAGAHGLTRSRGLSLWRHDPIVAHRAGPYRRKATILGSSFLLRGNLDSVIPSSCTGPIAPHENSDFGVGGRPLLPRVVPAARRLDRGRPAPHPGRVSQVHFDPAPFLDLMRREVPAYLRLQEEARATEGVAAASVLDLGTGTGETLATVL